MRKGYFLKRILMAVVILFVVILLNFVLPRLGPEGFDPMAQYYPAGASEEEKAIIREIYGYSGDLGKDLGVYLTNLVTFKFGTSFQYGRPVMEVIGERLPWTLVLSITSLLLNASIGILFGSYAAQHRGKASDKALLGAASFTTALPAFWIGMMLLLLFSFTLGWLPTGGRLDDVLGNWEWNLEYVASLLRHMFLPVLSMAIGGIISYAMTTRNAMISVTNEDYIMTAKAKGLSNGDVLYNHTLRNAMLPLVTTIGMSISTLIGGAVVVEQIFSWNGMGTLFTGANNAKDFPLMQAIMLIMSTLAIVANLMVDFLYMVLDPRIKDGK